jgi:hypothetical protein
MAKFKLSKNVTNTTDIINIAITLSIKVVPLLLIALASTT